jgi:hypothetical protein
MTTPPDFTPHDGGPRPVPLESRPLLVFSDGRVSKGTSTAEWWQGKEGFGPNLWTTGDIIAYKVEPKL